MTCQAAHEPPAAFTRVACVRRNLILDVFDTRARCCPRVLAQISERGSHDALMQIPDGEYRALWLRQMEEQELEAAGGADGQAESKSGAAAGSSSGADNQADAGSDSGTE